MRVAILTSNDIRHRYFVNALADRFEVVAIVYQETGYVPANTDSTQIDAATAEIVRMHFDERRRQEGLFFGDGATLCKDTAGCRVRHVDTRELNSDATVDLLRGEKVDVGVVYGTGLIKSPLIDAFAGRLINMHLGLSPYYRGTATNFYPLLNDEPEFVGATVHWIDSGIDAGPIIHHARPTITADDMPHTVGCKAIEAGIQEVLQTLDEFRAGRVESVAQWSAPDPKLYFRKDYHPSQVARLYELIDAGLFPRYAAREHRVRNLMRLVA